MPETFVGAFGDMSSDGTGCEPEARRRSAGEQREDVTQVFGIDDARCGAPGVRSGVEGDRAISSPKQRNVQARVADRRDLIHFETVFRAPVLDEVQLVVFVEIAGDGRGAGAKTRWW